MNSSRCRAQGFLSVFIPMMILIMAINSSVFAQWSRTAPNIYQTTLTDKVGIGVSTPSDVLDVRMPSSVNQAGLTISGPTVTGNGSQPAVVFKRYNGSTLNTVSKVYSNNGDILFTTGTGTSPSDRMIIDNAGRVGIGTLTPGVNYKLDVNGVFHVINGNQALFSNSGTAALPSISFDNDQNTGLFNPGNADVIGFATQGSERMRIDQAGHVGIGTSPGNFSLDVSGILHVANGNQALFSTTSTANIPAIAFDINNNTGFFSPSDDNLGFATGGQERMRINPNGYIGINTTNPGNGQAVSLHVNGPVMLTNIPALGGAATYYLGIEGSTGIVKTRTPSQVFSDISGGACPPNPMTALGDMLYGATAGACTRLPGNTTTTKKFLSQTGTGSASAMPAWATLTNADVGLGNVENTALSTWAGSGNITTLGTIVAGSVPWARITGAPAIPPAQVNSDWAATAGAALILNKPPIYSDGSNTGIGIPSTLDKKLVVNGGDVKVIGASWGALGSLTTMYLGDTNHYIRATYDSGVSIGTYGAPNAVTLAQTSGDVTITKGNLSVTNGKINVKGWSIDEAPDYVFEKDYKLPKLNEVETFVKEHKHLADVPSAKDMNKNGLDITSMNMKLLKKIEELTLYTIEQNKKIEVQDKKLQAQNERLEELERKMQEGTK